MLLFFVYIVTVLINIIASSMPKLLDNINVLFVNRGSGKPVVKMYIVVFKYSTVDFRLKCRPEVMLLDLELPTHSYMNKLHKQHENNLEGKMLQSEPCSSISIKLDAA